MIIHKKLNAVLIGCGYISYYYALIATKHNHIFNIIGCYDLDTERMTHWAKHFSVKSYGSADEAMHDESADFIINLTPPDQHFDVNLAALNAGKHIYCEKPLAMNYEDAQTVLNLAKQRQLLVGSAPCSVMTDSICKVLELLENQAIGKVRFVNLSMHDFRVDLARPDTWVNPLGVMWPYQNEFKVGCTNEHSAYSLAIATSLFGPVTKVSSIATTVIPEKIIAPDETILVETPDYTVSVLQFENGIVAQLTCGIVSHVADRSIDIQGDAGYIRLDDCWNYNSPVTLVQRIQTENGLSIEETKFEFNEDANRDGYYNIDQARGITNLCNAILNRSVLLCGNEHK